jgi:hypothetical protein
MKRTEVHQNHPLHHLLLVIADVPRPEATKKADVVEHS